MRSSLVHDGRPVAAEALGLGDRFRYWRGRSGRRYLFTEVPMSALDDLSDVVVLMAAPSFGAEPHVTWVGEIDTIGRLGGPPPLPHRAARLTAYVHFLADTPAARLDVLDDLGQL